MRNKILDFYRESSSTGWRRIYGTLLALWNTDTQERRLGSLQECLNYDLISDRMRLRVKRNIWDKYTWLRSFEDRQKVFKDTNKINTY